uniref:Uncharacterized protein n=1 Tax=Spongospora subterranea TaxID=70186 RepID=A0A0H5QUC5_9EUKA|eukprot:CRZ05505.1 hypothetical protein [Spongospora subterranea]
MTIDTDGDTALTSRDLALFHRLPSSVLVEIFQFFHLSSVDSCFIEEFPTEFGILYRSRANFYREKNGIDLAIQNHEPGAVIEIIIDREFNVAVRGVNDCNDANCFGKPILINKSQCGRCLLFSLSF